MKKLLKLMALIVAVLAAVPATAVDLTPVPAPPGTVYGAPIEMGVPIEGTIIEGPVYVDSCAEPLFTNVKYVDRKEMHPCAIPKIIRVNDPCAGKHDVGCCGPKCVYIEICVPPCGCEEVKCRKHGDKVRYDYGKWAVDVRVKKGFIVVDYQD